MAKETLTNEQFGKIRDRSSYGERVTEDAAICASIAEMDLAQCSVELIVNSFGVRRSQRLRIGEEFAPDIVRLVRKMERAKKAEADRLTKEICEECGE